MANDNEKVRSTSSTRSGSTVAKPSQSGISARPKAAPSRSREVEDDEPEAPRRGYTKKTDDKTMKIIAIVGGLAMVGALATFVIVQMGRQDKIESANRAYKASQAAVAYIRAEFTSKTEDGDIDALEKIITQKSPEILTDHISELEGFKQELVRRREQAAQRKAFNELFDFLKANSKDPKKAEEVSKTLNKAELLMGFATDGQKKDMASFKVLNNVAILEARYQKALEVEQNPANKDNYAVICAAYQEAEEWFTGEAQSLIRAKVEGSDRAKELYETIQGKTNTYADLWATSDKMGFKAAAGINILDAKEFAKSGANDAHWSSSKLATYKLESGKMVASGLGGAGGAGDLRAGVLFWGPNGPSVRTMANGKDIFPGTRETMRHYQITMRFKVVKKGFTLLARHTGGYQRHAYGFETTAAQEESKAANKKARESGKTGGGGTPAGGAFSDPDPNAGSATETNFAVEEGKTYEVVEEVFGNKVRIYAKEAGGDQPEALEDGVRARYGGIGIQLLPGAEIQFEQMIIRILM